MPRRSTRAKRKSSSIYEDAMKEEEARLSMSSSKNVREGKEDESTDMDSEDEANLKMAMEVSSSDEMSDDDDDDNAVKTRRRKKAKDPPSATKKIAVRLGRKKTKPAPQPKAGTAAHRRAVKNALSALSARVLEEDDTSLVASLLKSYNSKADQKSRTTVEEPTMYTQQLESIAMRVMRHHKEDANGAQIQLLNLLFRSVGGSARTDLQKDVDIEDMDDDQWERVVTDVVDEMRHTPPESVLLTAGPHHAATRASLGLEEYRKIFLEFWYLLGHVILRGDVDPDDEDDESTVPGGRFEIETARDVIVRMTDLVTVGQPDIRAAATMTVYQLGHAVLDRTRVLSKRLEVAKRQFQAAKKGSSKEKAASLKHELDSLKRSMADLEEVVEGTIVQGVFMHRYRDTNMHIRAASIRALAKMSLQRPDMFLMDKFLKYLGWMMSDKAPCVRIESLAGLLAPFQAAQEKDSKIKLAAMDNVIKKFLPRIADCVIDQDRQVQDKAMTLLLALLRSGFLDEVEDENIWNQINLIALAEDASPVARRDALYFVIEQLEAFDSDSGKKGEVSEQKQVERIEQLASWVSHTISDSEGIPMDKIRVHLADMIVHSLREMPEHKMLVTSWPALLRAIKNDGVAAGTGEKAASRSEGTKQRVLLRMLACAARLEVGAVAGPDFMDQDGDSLFLQTKKVHEELIAFNKTSKGRARNTSSSAAHEALSMALLNALPDLLMAYKGDSTVLCSLTALPRYISPSIFSLTQRKKDFGALVSNLASTFLESTDETVLLNSVMSLAFLSQGDHPRSSDALLRLKELAVTLRDRLLELFVDSKTPHTQDSKSVAEPNLTSERRRSARLSNASQSTAASDNDSLNTTKTSAALDMENSISLCLRRLRVLTKRLNLAKLLQNDTDDGTDDEEDLENFCNQIAHFTANKLQEREVRRTDSENGPPEVEIPEIWHDMDPKIHTAVAAAVKESMNLLLSIVLWKYAEADQQESDLAADGVDVVHAEDESEIGDNMIVRLQKELVSILQLCFEQFVDKGLEDVEYPEELISFASAVQASAGLVATDLRARFPKDWADSASPLQRACALTNDIHLIGGFVRYVRSREEELRANEQNENENMQAVQDLLIPLCRVLRSNWNQGNRREAGVVLSHFTGSGEEALRYVSSMARSLKKLDPVRLLEAHMACLRAAYDDWVNSEPMEPESDRPTEEEMEEFEAAEKKHEETFQAIDQRASKLASSLGVGRITDPKLSRGLGGFVREGIRFAFSNDVPEEDEELVIGSRLPFLVILSRYATKARHNKKEMGELTRYLESKETELTSHRDFDEVHADDLAAIATFRKALGIKTKTEPLTPSSAVAGQSQGSGGGSVTSADEDGGHMDRTPSQASYASAGSRLRIHGSSVGSKMSRMSAQSSLSPLYEEDATLEEGDQQDTSPPPKKKRKGATGGRGASMSSFSLSTMGRTVEDSGEEASPRPSREARMSAGSSVTMSTLNRTIYEGSDESDGSTGGDAVRESMSDK